MKLTIDTDNNKLIVETNDSTKVSDLYSKTSFEEISRLWVKIGWNQKYPYTFSWMGRPIIQLPEDMIRAQEAIFKIRPDVIIETGIAHGGSLIYYASLCKVMGKGRVIGIDIEIRPQNRSAIEQHELFSYITLIEGDSASTHTVEKVKNLIKTGETTLVILDSCHTKEHVLNELHAYKDIVTKDSYIIATDGIMKDLYDVPKGRNDWKWDNPTDAAYEFVKQNKEFVLDTPQWVFNESDLTENITHWPGAWVKRI